ncbi:MAG: hypothetical protein ACRC6E_02240 [Fusobacteriaceae bacterium]
MAINIGKFETSGTVFRPGTDKFGNATCTLSTGRKKGKDSQEYINSNWLCKFVGSCKSEALELEEKDRIIIKSAQIDSVYNKESGKTFTGITIFEFEKVGGSTKKKAAEETDEFPF